MKHRWYLAREPAFLGPFWALLGRFGLSAHPLYPFFMPISIIFPWFGRSKEAVQVSRLALKSKDLQPGCVRQCSAHSSCRLRSFQHRNQARNGCESPPEWPRCTSSSHSPPWRPDFPISCDCNSFGAFKSVKNLLPLALGSLSVSCQRRSGAP